MSFPMKKVVRSVYVEFHYNLIKSTKNTFDCASKHIIYLAKNWFLSGKKAKNFIKISTQAGKQGESLVVSIGRVAK